MFKANKHALIEARRRLVRENMKQYKGYLEAKAKGLTTQSFAQYLKND